MKIRNGFVSNSSSSSFVLIGFQVEGNYKLELLKMVGVTVGEDEDLDDVFADNRWFKECVLLEDGDDGVPYPVFGKVIATASDEDSQMENNVFDLTELQKKVEEYKSHFSKTGEIKLYTGTRSC